MRLFLATFLPFAFANLATAQYANFQDVDKVVSADLQTFRNVFQSAYADTVTIAMFGDSQETVPDAGGANYVPAFNLELNRHFGNTPVSGIAFADSYSSRWLLAGSQHGVVENSGKNRDSQLLPSQTIGRFDNSVPIGGLLAQLNLDAGGTTPKFDDPGLEFDGRRVRVEVAVRDSIGSGEVQWRVNVQDGDGKNYFGGVDIASGVTNLGLGVSNGDYSTAVLGVFEVPDGHDALQVIARGADANGVDIAGIRFFNEDNPVGIATESFSAGGYRSYRIRRDHGDADEAFRAIANHDIVALHFGANDSIDRTASQFREDLVEAIDNFRDWSGDENKPIILFSDPDRVIGNDFSREQFDQFAGVAADIALSLDNVLAVNSRLLTHEIGWRADGDLLTYAGDGVHYTPFGAQRLAELEVGALVQTLAVPEPSSLVLLFTGLSSLCCLRRRNLGV